MSLPLMLRPTRCSILVLSIHTLAIAVLAAYIASLLAKHGRRGEIMPLWTYAAILDLPSSIFADIFASGIDRLDDPTLQKTNLAYAVAFCVLGGIQYYVIASLLCAFVKLLSPSKTRSGESGRAGESRGEGEVSS